MENFIIKSSNKKIQVNGIELDLLFDDNDFSEKMLELSDTIDQVIDSNDIKEINKLAAKEAIHDTEFGKEFLKSSVKIVCTNAGILIGGSIGYPGVGKK